ncbi:hypothetical protein [Comamonas sp. wu1-DMT]
MVVPLSGKEKPARIARGGLLALSGKRKPPEGGMLYERGRIILLMR